MTTGALAHLRVLDVSQQVAGPYATKLMAGFGAEVIKVEPPAGGDVMRSVGPFHKEEPGVERSIPFLWLNTGKKSITLDLTAEKGRNLLRRLTRTADVVVQSSPPSTMDELGLHPDSLRAEHSGVVVTCITNFGLSGPNRDLQAEEIVEYAMSGLMHLTGDPTREPLCAGPNVTHYTAGMYAYIGTLMALFQRAATGDGQVVDVSVQESALDNVEVALAEYLHLGRVAKRTGDEHALVPWQLFPCQDGHVAVIGGPVRHWLKAVDLFEEPRLADPPFRHMRDRIARRQEVKELIRPWLDRHGRKEIYHQGQARGLAFGYLATFHDVLASPQHQARGFFEDVDHPVVGRHAYCGPPFRLESAPWRTDAAPLLGQNNDEVYCGLGCSAEEIDDLRSEGVL